MRADVDTRSSATDAARVEQDAAAVAAAAAAQRSAGMKSSGVPLVVVILLMIAAVVLGRLSLTWGLGAGLGDDSAQGADGGAAASDL